MKSTLLSPRLAKVLFLLLGGLFFRVFIGCRPPDPIEMSYNRLRCFGVDNSAAYLNPHSSLDTMYAEAIALHLELTDTLLYGGDYYSQSWRKANWGLDRLYAWTLDQSFKPIAKVGSLQIFTMVDLDATTRAGDEITADWLYAPDSFELYLHLEEAIDELNRIQDASSAGVCLVYKGKPEAEEVQFKVEVVLSDGRRLSCESPVFTLLPELL